MTTVDEARAALLNSRGQNLATLVAHFEAAVRAEAETAEGRLLDEALSTLRAESDETLRAALAAVGLPETASIDDLIRHHRNNEAATNGAWKIMADAQAETLRALREVAAIMRRHTHQGPWAMSRFAGPHPESDCLLCRALVTAGVLTLDQIGAGTRAAIAATPAEDESREPHTHPDGSTWHGRRTGWVKVPYIEGNVPSTPTEDEEGRT